MKPRCAWHNVGGKQATALLWALAAYNAAYAGSASSTPSSSPSHTTGAVALEFSIQIDKFIFFRIGDATATSQVTFALTPSIPSPSTTPTVSNNTSVNWSGTAPSFNVAPTGNKMAVEVRSNGGPVSLFATVTTPLTSGSKTIPMSDISITSSDASLSAPTPPASGTGASVNVAGGGVGSINSLVTLRSADWTFSYTSSTSRFAGNYSGQITFTATTP